MSKQSNGPFTLKNVAIGLSTLIIVCFISFIINRYVEFDSSYKLQLGLSPSENVENMENVHSDLSEENQTPDVNPKVGSIMDGPGYEKEMDNEQVDSSLPQATADNFYFLDDGANGEMSIQHNLCSKSCCSNQWPTPFKNKYDPYVCKNKNKFTGSNYFCSNTFQDSGCLCLTKKQAKFLYNRGGNGREWF